MNSLSFILYMILAISRSCLGVTVTVDGEDVDCALNCACCKGGVKACGNHFKLGNNTCFNGCVEGIYGYRCHNPCRGNCYTCSQERGLVCYSCKETFYDTNSYCNNTCSVRCDGGSCNNDGTCNNCIDNYNGICTECAKGLYLDVHGNCTTCSTTCIDNSCDASNGRCIAGCVEGYWGEQCDKSCNILCKTCNRLTGYCNTCLLTSLHGLYCNLTTVASGVSVGITAVIGVIALVIGGITCALIIAVILKRRRKIKRNNPVVSLEQRPADTGHSNIGVNVVYDKLKINPDGTTQQDDHQYKMIEATTVQVDRIERGENESNYEHVAGNDYYNER